jgi:hypothetical protein
MQSSGQRCGGRVVSASHPATPVDSIDLLIFAAIAGRDRWAERGASIQFDLTLKY